MPDKFSQIFSAGADHQQDGGLVDFANATGAVGATGSAGGGHFKNIIEKSQEIFDTAGKIHSSTKKHTTSFGEAEKKEETPPADTAAAPADKTEEAKPKAKAKAK